MKLGLDSYSFHLAFGSHPDFRPLHPLDLFGFIERVAEYGLDGFQIDPYHLKTAEDGYLRAVREEARARKLFIEYGVASVHPDAIREGVRVCRVLGSTVLRTFLGFDRFDRRTSVQAELAAARENVTACLPSLEGAGVRLAIENHGDVTSGELVTLVEEIGSPAVGICLDVGNSLAVLEDPLDAARRMIPFTYTTHFKDYSIVGTPSGYKAVGVALGRGVLPLDELYRLIEEEGIVERLILEIPVEARHGEHQTLEAEESAVRESVSFCRNLLFVGNP
jgi:sugar phosphate isomerase/epimerase